MLKPMYERQLMGDFTPPGELGKNTLDTKLWSKLLISSTPYGHCMDASGNYIVRPTSARWGHGGAILCLGRARSDLRNGACTC